MTGERETFYVGYRALPRRHAVFLMVAIPAAVLVMGVSGLLVARSQPGWGGGFWQTGEASLWRGTLTLEPYPMLHASGEDGEVETYLLVEMGKFGAADRFAGSPELDGASVAIRGRELARDGRRMIELDPDDPSLGPPVEVVEDEPGRAVRFDASGETVRLTGEIVDSKCYLGAMKPGAGRGHKACATLCINGGIPPVLVSRGPDGGAVYHLLTDNAGAGLGEADLAALVGLIGEPVVLSGRPGRIGSWRVLRIESWSPAGAGVPSPAP